MRKEGIKRQDFGCCPGHDKFPNHTYNTRASKKAKRRTDQLANMRARRSEIIFNDGMNPIKTEISNK